MHVQDWRIQCSGVQCSGGECWCEQGLYLCTVLISAMCACSTSYALVLRVSLGSVYPGASLYPQGLWYPGNLCVSQASLCARGIAVCSGGLCVPWESPCPSPMTPWCPLRLSCIFLGAFPSLLFGAIKAKRLTTTWWYLFPLLLGCLDAWMLSLGCLSDTTGYNYLKSLGFGLGNCVFGGECVAESLARGLAQVQTIMGRVSPSSLPRCRKPQASLLWRPSAVGEPFAGEEDAPGTPPLASQLRQIRPPQLSELEAVELNSSGQEVADLGPPPSDPLTGETVAPGAPPQDSQLRDLEASQVGSSAGEFADSGRAASALGAAASTRKIVCPASTTAEVAVSIDPLSLPDVGITGSFSKNGTQCHLSAWGAGCDRGAVVYGFSVFAREDSWPRGCS